jgi:hypothetical protein
LLLGGLDSVTGDMTPGTSALVLLRAAFTDPAWPGTPNGGH